MRTKGLNIIEMAVLVIATVVLLMALLTFSVNAQGLASSANAAMTQSYKHEKNPTGNKPSSDNSTMTKADILKQSGVPGKGIDHAPGLQKPFNPKSNAADNAGKKDNPTSDNKTMTRAEIMKQSSLPGKGIEIAPGLSKPSNLNIDEDIGIKRFLYRWQQRFQTMIQKYFKGTNSK